MFRDWHNIIITDVVMSCFVPPGKGKSVHNNRPSHGLVINVDAASKTYVFSDGSCLNTDQNDLFYLPESSSYVVNSTVPSGCYAINFKAENLSSMPFAVKIKNAEPVIKLFKESETAWRKNPESGRIQIIRNLYDIIYKGEKEQARGYQPKSKELIIEPAVEYLKNAFCSNDISVAGLSEMCGITEAYFRRIFTGKYGMTPKEYIISKRMEYAKKLLASGDFSVMQVADICGYSEPCHFSREFTRNTGVSPSKYITN